MLSLFCQENWTLLSWDCCLRARSRHAPKCTLGIVFFGHASDCCHIISLTAQIQAIDKLTSHPKRLKRNTNFFYLRNKLPIEFINHIMRFNSHPLAGIARNNISTARYGKYYSCGERIRWLFSEETVLADNYETYVLEQHIKNNDNSKHVNNDNIFDKVNYHINMSHIVRKHGEMLS